jgi:hypothetical protein
MTITLDLKPEVEERVLAHAQAQGVSLETYLASLIEAQVAPLVPPRASLEQFLAELEELSEGTEGIPVLPPEALTRAGIYGDHD